MSETPKRGAISRRTIIAAAGVAASAAGALSAAAASGQTSGQTSGQASTPATRSPPATAMPPKDAALKVATKPASTPPAPAASGLGTGGGGQVFWVAETSSGKVRGIDNAGIKEFKGIPYGAPTGGANRFMAPKPPASWSGVRDSIGYGQISPQTPADITSEYAQMIMWDRHVGPGGMGEDCLNLNVWTPGVDGAKRAVMVSFHGGGWATGSGNGPMYDGANLAKFGDVVVVTVNHRLAAFGYLYTGALPDHTADLNDGGAVGVADMVASLRWVRDNIAAFGGDPGRVMIFGQSGGGSKVSTLLATPSAKGLFHRAAIQSGSTLSQRNLGQGGQAAEFLAEAFGGVRSVAPFRKASWTELLQAQTDAMAKGANFSPVIGNSILPHHPFEPTAPTESADVPVIISTTLEDAALRLTNFDLDAFGLYKITGGMRPDKAGEITRLYLDANFQKSPYLIQAQMLTDAQGRRNAIIQAERRVALKAAPTWMYIWGWATPAFDGKFGAVHGHDVDASFHIARSPIAGAGMSAGHLMADRLASAWVAFAKTGDPNNPAIPTWAPYNLDGRPTMIFDTNTRVDFDPRKEFRELWA